MQDFFYIEDVLKELCRLNAMHNFVAVHSEYKTLMSFNSIVDQNHQLTQSQGNLLIKLLSKYQDKVKQFNFEYQHLLVDPQWRNEFRILDTTRKIFVRVEKDTEILICCKFPYQLKEEFDLEFFSQKTSNYMNHWDPDEKIRKIPLDEINIIQLYDWGKRQSFNFEENFLNLLHAVENIWENEEKISPYSEVYENSVVLFNSTSDADNFFSEKSLGILEHDLLLAKSMNFLVKFPKKPKNIIEKICSSKQNIFWLKDIEKFFETAEKIQGKICVLIDRASERDTWLKNFVKISEKFPSERQNMKVCFRDDKETKGNFNQWIKDMGLGGAVGDAKYLIFENKPAKWLFRDKVDVKIIVTNNLYINSNPWVNDWMAGHPCVIYLSDVKPTLKKVQTIGCL